MSSHNGSLLTAASISIGVAINKLDANKPRSCLICALALKTPTNVARVKQKNTICSTHPHNYHLEVLHDTGLVGFVIITFFVFYLLINKSKLIFSSNISYSEKIFLSLIVINFLIEIFPIKSTGSLFTTWNGTLLWISIALLNYKNYSDARWLKITSTSFLFY